MLATLLVAGCLICSGAGEQGAPENTTGTPGRRTRSSQRIHFAAIAACLELSSVTT